MTPAATPEALKQALAHELARLDGWQDPNALWADNLGIIARGGEGSRVYLDYVEDAGKLIAGPLAPILADLQRVTAERDEAREKIDAARVVAEGWPVLEGQETVAGKIMTLAAAARQAPLGERGTQFVLQHLMRALDAADTAEAALATATAEAASLRAEVEGLKAALKPHQAPPLSTALARAATAGEGRSDG